MVLIIVMSASPKRQTLFLAHDLISAVSKTPRNIRSHNHRSGRAIQGTPWTEGSAGFFQRASLTGQLQECSPVIFTAPSSSRRAADSIKIDMVAPLTGPFAATASEQMNRDSACGAETTGGRPMSSLMN
jgi:hypothetical protein